VIWIALTIVVAVAGGVAAERRLGERAGTLARSSLKVMLYVLVPPVVFFNLARLEINADVGAGLVLGWVVVVLSGLVAYAVGRRLRLERREAGALINATLHPNTGYLGLPMTAAILGADHLDEAIAYDVLVGTPTLLLAVFAVGAAFGDRAGDTVSDRVRAFFTRNPPLVAAVLGLLAPDALAPDVLVEASRVLVFALLPVGFWAVGVTLAEDRALPPPLTPHLAAALVLRLVVAPVLYFALAAPFIDLPKAYLLAAAMPTGLNGLVVAHAYGLDLRLAAGAVAWGTAFVLVAAVILTA
jgi:predicted permease